MLRIPSESEKGNTHRTLPMAPEFAQLLAAVPERDRTGYVFKLPAGVPRTRHAACRRFAAIGEAAGIIAKQKAGVDDKGKPCVVNQYATPHDLRRSFGFRWSPRVMPTVLRKLMRHESIETTMRYYVGQNAEATADELWRVTGQSEPSSVAREETPRSESGSSGPASNCVGMGLQAGNHEQTNSS
jgi:integrase